MSLSRGSSRVSSVTIRNRRGESRIARGIPSKAHINKGALYSRKVVLSCDTLGELIVQNQRVGVFDPLIWHSLKTYISP